MKTTLKKLTGAVKSNNFILPVLFAAIAVMTSGSTLITGQEVRKNSELQEKKINLLEKLEKGSPIATEEIRAFFGEQKAEPLPECQQMISHEEIEKMKESIIRDLDEIKLEIGSFKNSDKFEKALDELKRGSDEIKRELEKMREELKRSDKRSGEWENA
jgi:uncharacterized coiled-coil DUF342 family protein